MVIQALLGSVGGVAKQTLGDPIQLNKLNGGPTRHPPFKVRDIRIIPRQQAIAEMPAGSTVEEMEESCRWRCWSET